VKQHTNVHSIVVRVCRYGEKRGSGDERHAAKSRGTLLVEAWAIASGNTHNLQTIYDVTEMYVFRSNVRNRKNRADIITCFVEVMTKTSEVLCIQT